MITVRTSATVGAVYERIKELTAENRRADALDEIADFLDEALIAGHYDEAKLFLEYCADNPEDFFKSAYLLIRVLLKPWHHLEFVRDYQKPPSNHLPERTVTCAWCKNRHRYIVPKEIDRGRQGDECASTVFEQGGKWYVQGNYGSGEYDTKRFVFVKNEPRGEACPVCNNCIGERYDAGDLDEVEGHYP